MKFQRIIWFAIGSHAIHVHARRDTNNHWFPIMYKLSNVELEAIIDDWPVDWHEPFSIEEVLVVPPTDAMVDPLPDP